MTANERFLFENSFDSVDGKPPEYVKKRVKPGVKFRPGFPDKNDELDEEEDLNPDEGGPGDEPQEDLPPPPIYTEEDLVAAREKEFAAGKEAGREEERLKGEQSDEEKTVSALSLIGERLSELFRIQEEENSRISKESTEFSLAVVRKLFPELNKAHGLAEVEALVMKTLGNLTTAPKIKLFVNPALHHDISGKITELTEKAAFAGSVVVLEEDNVAAGDCTIEWSNGGCERVAEDMWREIDAVIERGLDELYPDPPKPDKEPDKEPIEKPGGGDTTAEA